MPNMSLLFLTRLNIIQAAIYISSNITTKLQEFMFMAKLQFLRVLIYTVFANLTLRTRVNKATMEHDFSIRCD